MSAHLKCWLRSASDTRGEGHYRFYTLSQPTVKVLHILAFPNQAHATKHLSEPHTWLEKVRILAALLCIF